MTHWRRLLLVAVGLTVTIAICNVVAELETRAAGYEQ